MQRCVLTAAIVLMSATGWVASPLNAAAPMSLETAQGFLTRHCAECHSGGAAEGEVSLEKLAAIAGGNTELWQRVLVQLATAAMPPADQPQPSRQEVGTITTWIQSQLIAAGHESDIAHKLRQPAYANLLNHEKLFDGSPRGPAFSPPRLWRLHPEAYESFLQGFGRELGMGGPLSKPFTVGDGKGAGQQLCSI